MRHELEKVREILQKAAVISRRYHENIDHVRKTCRPELILKETEVFSKPLKESMEKAKNELREEMSGMETAIRKETALDPKKYNKEVVHLVQTLKPDAEELEVIAEQFTGNDTMIRFFRKHCDENGVLARLPLCGVDRLKNAEQLRIDLEYVLNLAGEPTSATNKYGDSQLQHFAENFEKVFNNQIQAIGD